MSTVEQCEICQVHQTAPAKAPLHPWERPSKPWSRLHIDHAGPFLGKLFLVVIDAYSKWMDVVVVNSTSAECTINKLRSIFTIHGLPEQVVSDNGSSFTSSEFKTFLQANGIRQVLVSPYHPSSNGLAERAVQTFKSAVKKLDGPMELRLSRFLSKYRVLPQTTTGFSPAELLMGRRLRTHLDLLHPDSASPKAMDSQYKALDSAKHPPRVFKEGDRLFAKAFNGHQQWIPVTVKAVSGPLSYRVSTSDGSVIRRHVDHLRIRHTPDHTSFPDEEESNDWMLYSKPRETQCSNVALPVRPSSSEPAVPLHRHSTRTRTPIDRYSPSEF